MRYTASQLCLIAWQLNRKALGESPSLESSISIHLHHLTGDELTRHLAHLGV